LKGKVRVNLVVDSAGKVRSVKVSGKKEVSEYLKRSTDEWKFTPALVRGRSVASRVRMTLTLAQ
jgi:outer membrane biosynthesis protein TonB